MKGSVEWSSIVDEGTGARDGISGQEQHWGRGNRSKRRSSIVDEGKGARAGISGKEQHFGRRKRRKRRDLWVGVALWMRGQKEHCGSVESTKVVD